MTHNLATNNQITNIIFKNIKIFFVLNFYLYKCCLQPPSSVCTKYIFLVMNNIRYPDIIKEYYLKKLKNMFC